MRSQGADVWSFEDELTFHGRPVTGDFDLAVRIVSLQGDAPLRMAGLMVRSNTSPGAANTFVKARPNDIRLTSRRVPDGQTTAIGGTGTITSNTWLRLRRVDDVVTAFISPDGTDWSEIGRARPTLGGVAYVGVAASAGARDAEVAVQFRDFSDLAATASRPPAVTDLTAQAMAASVELTWTSPGRSDFFVVERRSLGGAWERLTLADGPSFVDDEVLPGTSYQYRVAAETSGLAAPFVATEIVRLA
jgi:regulation of enolase protein 1 (concanavalin A-like superfamily)